MPTFEQVAVSGTGFLLISLIAIITHFLRKTLAKLDHLDKCLDEFKLATERNFVGHAEFNKRTDDLRNSVIDLYKKDNENSKILAKLEAHIDVANVIRQFLSGRQ